MQYYKDIAWDNRFDSVTDRALFTLGAAAVYRYKIVRNKNTIFKRYSVSITGHNSHIFKGTRRQCEAIVKLLMSEFNCGAFTLAEKLRVK